MRVKRTEALVKKLIVFDLDGTLAESKSSLDPEMSGLLHNLLGIVKVAVISGGDWPQFEKQVVSKLPHDQRLANLSLLPTCGTKFYQYSGDWKNLPRMAQKLLSLPGGVDVLVVDGNSSDGTGKIADELAAKHPQIHVLHEQKKNGLGRAYIAGFQWALERSYEFIFE